MITFILLILVIWILIGGIYINHGAPPLKFRLDKVIIAPYTLLACVLEKIIR